MNGEKLTIVAASPNQFEDIFALFQSVGLPIEDIAEHLQNFLLAVDDKCNDKVNCRALKISLRPWRLFSVKWFFLTQSRQGRREKKYIDNLLCYCI